jgi:hypothetical protein
MRVEPNIINRLASGPDWLFAKQLERADTRLRQGSSDAALIVGRHRA